MNGHKFKLQLRPAGGRFFQRRRFEVVVARQHQDTFIGLRVAAKLVQQRFQLVIRQQGHGFFIPRAQAIERLRQLVRVLLDKAVGDFTNPGIEAVGRVQIAAVPFAKIVVEHGRQRKLCPAEAIVGLPVVAHRKQRRMLILRP